jgi:hypothetical protein
MKSSAASNRKLAEGQHQVFTSEGEEDRVVLIDWLNAATGSKSFQRVRTLIRQIQSAETAVDAATRDGVFIHVGQREDRIPLEKSRRRREVDKLLRPIGPALMRYVFHPRLTCTLFGRSRWWFDLFGESVAGDYRLKRGNERRVYEADAVFGVLRLASAGLLDRVRQCLMCQKWLYARPSHKKFCDTDCQLKYFASTPMQKEKRARYMRDYRTDQKEKLNRELLIARKPIRN